MKLDKINKMQTAMNQSTFIETYDLNSGLLSRIRVSRLKRFELRLSLKRNFTNLSFESFLKSLR